MKIEDALAGVTRLGFDTPAIIYLIERHPVYYPRVRPCFTRMSAGTVSGVTSVVTLVEVLTLPLARGKRELARRYRGVLVRNRHLQLVHIDAAIAERAAALRVRYRLRTPDALQLAAALAHGCEAFVTNDRDLARVTDLRMLILDDLDP